MNPLPYLSITDRIGRSIALEVDGLHLLRGTLFFFFFLLVQLSLFFVPTRSAWAEEILVYVQVSGESAPISKKFTSSIKQELQRIKRVSVAPSAEVASVVVSFSYKTLPSDSDVVIYSFAYGINELESLGDLEVENGGVISIPRFVFHDVRWCKIKDIESSVSKDILQIEAELFSLVQ